MVTRAIELTFIVLPSRPASGVPLSVTKIRVRIAPNRKQDGGTLWESLEAIIEKDLAAQNATENQQ
jgi:hypothetical protein